MSHSYGRIVFVLLGVGVAVYLCWKITQRVDAFLYPWANERSGQPLLTGSWVGYADNAGGAPLGVMLELHRWQPEHASECSNCNTLRGRAVTCDDAGAQFNYRVSGKPANRTATRFSLGAKPADEGPGDAVELGVLQGTWEANALSLEAEFRPREPASANNVSAAGDNGGSIHLAMQRAAADVFQTLCERISRSISQ